jgi:hypothetical protein
LDEAEGGPLLISIAIVLVCGDGHEIEERRGEERRISGRRIVFMNWI